MPQDIPDGTAFSNMTTSFLSCRYKLNIWDVGGQKTLRPYWRNYYEKTDGLIWVVDSADLARLEDCRKELHSLLQEERLFGATLLILANKQDIPAALSLQAIEQVSNTFQSSWMVYFCCTASAHVKHCCHSVSSQMSVRVLSNRCCCNCSGGSTTL